MLASKAYTAPTRQLGLAALALLVIVLAGCKTLPQIASAAGSGQNTSISPTAELPPAVERRWPNASQDVINERARGFGLINMPDMQRYLNTLYARIKEKAGAPKWPGSVYILANDALSAYATAAGNIYISLPWLTSAESEDEIVALLSHEFGHIYLHYHEVDETVQSTDKASDILAIGIAISNKTAAKVGWTEVDTLMASYQLGKSVLTSAYGRSEEEAADTFALNISTKLGYSYEHGMKSFLERLATWEEENEAREQKRQDELIKGIKAQALALAQQESPGSAADNNLVSQWLRRNTGELNGNINGALQKFAFDIGKFAEKIVNTHPDITRRIDAISVLASRLPESASTSTAVTKPFNEAISNKRTQTILGNYNLAFKAIQDPKSPKSAEYARKSVTGPTATHAVPLFALYTVLNEQPSERTKREADPGIVLEANFNAESDRAWKLYNERAARLQARRNTNTARKVMDQGFGYFQNAEAVWPDSIRFYGTVLGWDQAKKMSQRCGSSFERMRKPCMQAAMSPAELEEADRKTTEKAKQIANKIMKKS